MPDFGTWRNTHKQAINAARRAQYAWGRILRDPVDIQLTRDRAANPPLQTVRISADNTSNEVNGAAGVSSTRSVIIFGVRDHPDSDIPDTDIQRGDKFRLDGVHYRVVDVVRPPGEVQARAEAGV